MRGVPAVADFLPSQYINKQLIPALCDLTSYLNENVPVRLILIIAGKHLSPNHLLHMWALCGDS